MSTVEKKGRRQRPAELKDLLARQLPINLEAEVSLLGSIVMLPNVLDEIVDIVKADDFHAPANRVLYESLFAMYNDSKKIDVALLRERLVSRGEYETVGGATYLAHVFNSVPNAAHAVYYARIVHEKATLRQLIETCTGILQTAYETTDDVEGAISAAEEKIFSIGNEAVGQVQTLESLLHDALQRIDVRMKGEPTPGTVETGFADLDTLTGGMHAAEFLVLAARPSMGKTAFALNIVEHVVLQQKKPVLLVSLEMSGIEVVERMLCSIARVNGHKLRNGRISPEERRRLVQQATQISASPLFIDDAPSRTVAEIAGAARRIKRRHGELGLLVIDYLQLIQPEDAKNDQRQEQVAKIARRLKTLARELRIPVLCLSQLNRQAEDSREHTPRLSHLRESGAIEQDADVVMFVHREEYFLRGEEKATVEGEAQIIVAKQLNGPIDTINLVWQKDYTRFEDRAPERHEEFSEYAI